LGAGGGSATLTGYRIDYNIGEMAIQTAGTNPVITEGFEQPEMVDAPLPVLGLNLKVRQEGKYAYLTFSTVQEFKSAHFIVERSSDGLHFDTLAIIKTKAVNGYSSGPLYYDYQDPAVLNSTVYYRIIQVDVNGDSMSSSVVAISVHKDNLLKVFPNPATSQVTVHLGNLYNGTRVQLYSMAGKLMYNKMVTGNSDVIIVLDKWPAGVYLIFINQNGFMKKIKFIKK